MTELAASEAPSDLDSIRRRLGELRAEVGAGAQARLERWRPWTGRDTYRPSAENLAAYLALRQHDVRALQSELVTWGVSSLGRCEPYVLPNLDAAGRALGALAGEARGGAAPTPERAAFAALESRLAAHTRELFGDVPTPGIMVTFPSEAAHNPALIRELLEAGMTVARINLAHDGPAEWAAMLAHLRTAREQAGQPCRVLMDLAGPKVRTGPPRWEGRAERLRPGDRIFLGPREEGLPRPGLTCTLPEALSAVEVGHTVWIDDGKIGTVVEARSGDVLALRVTHAPAKGGKLRPEKGLNFPDTLLRLPALTDKDRTDLPFVARHADLVGYSFVQTVGDVEILLAALDAAGAPTDLGLVLKIETRHAVQNLADLMVRAAGARPTGVMIARGDLAVELGFARLTEIQEQMLWLAEAAHLPVIWATQVLEALVKKGERGRGEYTDAAGGVRAECIMLNKGPYVVQGVRELSDLIARMRPHFDKKRPQFRALSVAQPSSDRSGDA